MLNKLNLNSIYCSQSETLSKIQVFLVDFEDKYEPKIVEHIILSPTTTNKPEEFSKCFSTPTT